MIDTHTHIYFAEDFGEDMDEVVARAKSAGVSKMIFPNVDRASVPQMLALHERYPEATELAAGLHPTEVDGDWRAHAGECLRLLDGGGCVALGEIGMDLHWDRTFEAEQREALAFQLREAQRRGLPAIIHCREALEETLEVMRSFGDGLPPVLFHSFTGTAEDVRRIREVTDAMFGINGVVTFKNAASLREALPEIGLDRIVLETDSPYLAPVPKRGKRNESSYIMYVRDAVAGVLGVTPEDVEAATDANATRFFTLRP